MAKIKRIIEIDEEDYNTIMCEPDSPVLGWYEIAHSVPYNPSDGAISREAINLEIEKRYCSKHCVLRTEEPYCPDNCPARFLKNIVKECPTVPQVVVFAENADEKAIEDMKAELQNVIDSVRPQGEWYYSCDKGWECNQCHEIVKDMPTCMRKALYNFCPNCGAELRKGGAK